MSKSKHMEAQMIAVLMQVEAGRKVEGVALEHPSVLDNSTKSPVYD